MTLDTTLGSEDMGGGTTGSREAIEADTARDRVCGDRALVKRAQSGENEAFNQLVTRYRHRVLKVSLRYTHHADDAEDAAQNAFLKAHRAIHQFRGDSAFYSWLCRIAINSAKSIRFNRARDEGLLAPLHARRDDADAQRELEDWATPESLLAEDEICAVINSALSSLCKEQRLAIMLREFHELSYEEVAKAMACPVGTVRSRVFRAREAIDRQMRRILGHGFGRAPRF